MLRHLGAITARPVDLFHVEITLENANIPLVLSSPVTEVLSCYVSQNKSKSDFDDAINQFAREITKADGFIASAGGWSVEEASASHHKSLENEEGGKGKRYLGLLGWESLEKHQKLRDTELFKSAIPLLRNNIVGSELHHVIFQAY
jgi:hypothetical protein